MNRAFAEPAVQKGCRINHAAGDVQTGDALADNGSEGGATSKMAVKRIARMQGFRIYRDFSWPSALEEFSRFNLIFGWNGSGKSTLSYLFECLERRVAPSEGRVSVELSGATVSEADFVGTTENIRVFNRRYVGENIFQAAGTLAPIFVIGADNIAAQQEIESLDRRIKALDDEIDAAQRQKRQSQNGLNTLDSGVAKTIKGAIGSAGNAYANYNKANAAHAFQALESGNSVPEKLTDDGRAKLIKECSAMEKPALPVAKGEAPQLEILVAQVNELLQVSVGDSLAGMGEFNPAVANWRRQGLDIHAAIGEDVCQFCGSRLKPERLALLKKMLAGEFSQLQERIEHGITRIGLVANFLPRTAMLAAAADAHESVQGDFRRAREGLIAYCEEAKQCLDGLKSALAEKAQNPFEPRRADVKSPKLDRCPLAEYNRLVSEHNAKISDHEAFVRKSQKAYEADTLVSAAADRRGLVAEVATAASREATAAAERMSLIDQRRTLEGKAKSTAEAAERMNHSLHEYLGHKELVLKVEGVGYRIYRNDVAADCLSEGEQSAIALLHFLHKLVDREFCPATGAVVLDDPVTSLDSNSMFAAFAFIRAHTKDVAQLFVLTHNLAFFRAVRGWFHQLRGQDKNRHRLYMTCASHKDGVRCSAIRQCDPLLEAYDTDYLYLFKLVWGAAHGPGPEGMADMVGMPTIARRVLETFLAFRNPAFAKKSLYERLSAITFDEVKKARVFRFVNFNSHQNSFGPVEEEMSVLAETPGVMKAILELMELEDKRHYDGMVECARS